jgi:predicted chitinase
MPKSTAELRNLWQDFECAEDKMVLIPFGPDKIRVAPLTAPAWEALAAVLQHHGYKMRTEDTDSYNCRNIKGSDERSLHSFGIALDLNWHTNPFKDHVGSRPPRFSDKDTQDERADDVRLGLADTDMTREMIADILAIRTTNGQQVFEWGGNWLTVKDAMHFEIDLAPADLESQINPTTVAGGDSQAEEEGSVFEASEDPSPPPAPNLGVPHRVTARSGLKLRSGPGIGFDPIRTLPHGTQVFVLSTSGGWAQVGLERDGQADGFMSAEFLTPAAAPPAPGSAPVSDDGGFLGRVTADQVAKMFPLTKKANIVANLPFVLAGLRGCGLTDRSMVLMALATIRAETEGFLPISEGRSKLNTRITPFDKYDAGTGTGQALGNTQPGDGPRFKGRGYVQLTGRDNYTKIGAQIGVNLVADPDRANDPAVAGNILARFLKNKEGRIRKALANRDLQDARKAVNGGSHGFTRFKDAYDRGLEVLA